MEFGDRTAGEIMTPRVRIVTPATTTDRVVEVIELARETGHSRFPVLDATTTTSSAPCTSSTPSRVPLQERATRPGSST